MLAVTLEETVLVLFFLIIEDNFQYNTVGNYDKFSNFGAHTHTNTFEDYIFYINIPTKNTDAEGFHHNKVRDGIRGTSTAVKLDFTGGTHVFANYNCEIFKRVDGTARLSYVDNNDTTVITDYNS
jgi:hypothetical protein